MTAADAKPFGKTLLCRVICRLRAYEFGGRATVPRDPAHFTTHLSRRTRADWWRFFTGHLLFADIACLLIVSTVDAADCLMLCPFAVACIAVVAYQRTEMSRRCTRCGGRLRYYQRSVRDTPAERSTLTRSRLPAAGRIEFVKRWRHFGHDGVAALMQECPGCQTWTYLKLEDGF